MRIGLLLGSFNPIHRAHVAVARWALERGVADRVWIVPSPQNPLKDMNDMASFDDRVAMARLAVSEVVGVDVSSIEGELSAPHYTINTIEHLVRNFPDDQFFVLCGSDIIAQLPRWYRSEELRLMVDFVEYPRGAVSSDLEQFDESSSAIRRGELLDGLDACVRDYIVQHGLYFASPIERARHAMAVGDFPSVINLAVEYPQNKQIAELSKMARDILAFRCTDIYNP